MPESEIEPLDEVPSLSELGEGDASAIERVVVLKLNGGLGTSMGMTKAKSLLEVKDGHTFLDVIARQILQLREQHGAPHPAAPDEQLRDARRHARRARALPRAPGRRPAARLPPGQGAEAARRRRRAGRVARRPGARVGAARPRGRVRVARRDRACCPSCSSAATSTCSCRTPTTSARRSSRVCSAGWRARACRSSPRSSTAPRATARAATWRGGALTAGCCCARSRRSPTTTRRPSRTSRSTATSTPTTSG